MVAKFDQEGIQDARVISLLIEIREAQQAMDMRLVTAESNLTKHIDAAFPGGDPDGHRRYHETQIELLAERRRLRVAIQEKTISGLVFSGIILLITALYHWLVPGR